MRAMHFVAWIEQHTEYAETAMVIAEYVAKTAMLAHLPPESAQKYKDLLERMGIRLEKVNNEALAKCAMGVALPAIKSVFDGSNNSRCPPALTALVDAMSIARDIMHRVNDVANTRPDTIKQGAHNEMANFICANGNPSVEDFERAAISAYGKTAHWLALAMPSIDVNRGVKVVGDQLSRAYGECNEWAKAKIEKTKYHPEVDSMVHEKIVTNSMGLLSANTHAPENKNPSERVPSLKP